MKFLIRIITNRRYGTNFWSLKYRTDKTFLLAMTFEEAQKRIDEINKKEERIRYIFHQENTPRIFQSIIIPISDNFSNSKSRWINSENLSEYIERSYI